MTVSTRDAERHEHCPICSYATADPVFTKGGYELVRCSGCATVYVANPPTDAELEQLYSFASGYHVDFRDDALEIAAREDEGRRQLAFVQAHHTGTGKVFDVGASAGFFLAAAQSAGWRASGVELSPDTARLARDVRGVDVVEGRLEDVTLDVGSFDVVTLWDVIEHVRDPKATLEIVHGLLRPSGLVALSTPNLDGLYPAASQRVARLLDHWPAVEPPAHLFQFSVRTLTSLLEAVGFEVVAVRHTSQPLHYTFGTRKTIRNPARYVYKAVFAPLAGLGPHVRRGDEIEVMARKASDAPGGVPG